jgi:HSP20 family protein
MNGLIRYTRPLELFDWNRMLDNFFDDVPVWNTRTPAVDVKEEEKRYLMEVELPGLTDKDIELKVEDNILTLSSKKEESKEEKKNGYLLRERRSAEFCRTFVLPQDADRAEVKAEFKNGLLVVDIPKKPEAQPRKIDVKVN